ncbi:MAG: hypothetical protein D3924_04145 [Candidatus Electrothrix sp. AR4]|nr:hypothetical protein [Candidatus Electrothrix sp. AR4]
MKWACIAAIFSIFLLVSCAPAKRKKIRTTDKATERIAIDQAVGHETEVVLRSASADSILNRIVRMEMDKYDREQLNHIYERGVSGQISSWTNPEQESQYQVTPQPAYQARGNQVCRKAEIRAMVNSNGKVEKINTIACREKNGQWWIREER